MMNANTITVCVLNRIEKVRMLLFSQTSPTRFFAAFQEHHLRG